MGEAVRAMKQQHSIILAGEVFITNDPFAGGSHVPDVTVISPVFDDRNELRFFVANRAHHAEIGGINPGSMPPFSRNLEEEGVLLSGIKIRSYSPELMMQDLKGLESILLEHRYPSRSPADNIADLKAQIAANRAGASLLINLMKSTPAPQLSQTIAALFDSSTARINVYLDKILDGTSREAPKHFKDDVLSDLNVEVAIYRSYPQSGSAQPRFIFDFSGTASKTNSNLNANQAITRACLLYCLRCALAEEIPLTTVCSEISTL